jgi:integrase
MLTKDKGKEFYQSYYTQLIERLENTGSDEDIAFVRLGTNLSLRSREILSLKWSQVNYPYINDIYIEKLNKYYPPLTISEETVNALKKLPRSNDCDLIFNMPSNRYIERIRKSVGEINGIVFSAPMMRRIGTSIQ